MTPRRPIPGGQTDSEEDWAPQVPSVWDVPEDDADEPADSSDGGDFDADLYAPPFAVPARPPDWLDPEAWTAGELGAGRALAEAAEATGRLDERLRRTPEATRLAWRERLALADISTLLWAEGVRLRPERLALADADRLGRTGDEDQVIARAGWARRRLTGQGQTLAMPTSSDGVAQFLGRVAHQRPDETESADWKGLPEPLIPAGFDPAGATAWCAAMAGLDHAHPLTRSAAAFHLWRGFGISAQDAWLEPGVVAARVAAMKHRGGLSAMPLLAGSEHKLAGQGGGTRERLETWLTGLTAAAEHAQLTLDRIEAWHATALNRAAGMKGKGARALIGLLTARPIVSSADAARALDVSKVQTRTLLNRLEALGLVRELTGHTRFRFWAAMI